ncbi:MULTISPECIES: dienelactone hydrolase family protein [unclassified Bacillus (in: firmicutes)]|uniref:dienelactone hydrolase family protein n=1 Tax=unclassified Bacillus (in: firmicutes) TaxID=185979 RepID=UPI001BE6B942|nr:MULTISPECIES: dienelactone hydrolase family protein [unclassified Bacillus (in: firmicutes)]MBT2724987.1 dienelactone hydrolase family protein [Bacillus sp. ISL-46]MBT2744295.1 dienelactone hydrolase family protein [Bacillus sp. ISL-77]
MIKIHKNSDKVIIVIHEIYGINQHITDLCELLSEQYFDVICPNLLEQEIPFSYSQEEKAYRNFIDNVAFINALYKVKNILSDIKDEYSKIFVIGFSVGATVAWMCSEEEYVDGIVGYYGSRIRDFVNISPKCSTLLFFPEVEKSFNVDELISTLDKQNIDIHICKGEHGFSDPYSPKYNVESAQNTFRETLNFFRTN